jgi:hypothetical protein
VLENELRLACDRGAGAPADEIALLEDAEVRLGVGNKLVHGAQPKGTPDDGRRLECSLLARGKEVDPRRDDGLDGIGNGEPGGQLSCRPAPIRAGEDAAIDEGPQELLYEERVSLSVLDYHPADVLGKLGREELVEHSVRVRG